MSENQALVKYTDEEALALLSDAFDYKDNAERIVGMKVPLIKIQSQTQTFEFVDEQDESKKFKRFFESVIVEEFLARSWWSTRLGEGGGGQRPECFSADGRKPSSKVDPTTRQHDNCATCPQAQYESGANGRSQACKLNRNLIILDPTSEVATISVLRLPPTSIKKVDAFLYELLKSKMPMQAAVVRFSLEKKENKDKIVYSEVKLERVGITPAGLIPSIKQIAATIPELKVRIAGGTIEEAGGTSDGAVPF